MNDDPNLFLKPGPGRKLKLELELLLVMMRLRLGFLVHAVSKYRNHFGFISLQHILIFQKKEENLYGVIQICCNLFLFINGSEKKLLFNETNVLLSTGVFVF
jgi:hypothetical protein